MHSYILHLFLWFEKAAYYYMREALEMAEEQFYIQTSVCNTYCCYKPAESDTLVVMLHGLGGTRNSVFFRDLPQKTAHATLRFDLEGHGRSDGELSFSFYRYMDQFNELMADPRFANYKNRILIGHSKGGNLAILCAREGDTVICIAGRYHLDQFPEGSFTPEEKNRIEQGETLIKEFYGRNFKINRELLEEFENINNEELIKSKNIKLTVIAGEKDDLAPREQYLGFSELSVDGVHFIYTTHFDFKLDMVWDVVGRIV